MKQQTKQEGNKKQDSRRQIPVKQFTLNVFNVLNVLNVLNFCFKRWTQPKK